MADLSAREQRTQGLGRTRAVLRVTAVPLVVAALGLSGCGGGLGDTDSGDLDDVLSSETLRDALLVEGSTVAGAEVGPEDWEGLADDRVADPPSCQPLSAIIELETEPVRAERVQVDLPQWGPWVHVQLLTYSGDGAEEIFALVDKAVDSCAGGFNEDRIREVVISTVVREPARDLGDEVTAYSTTSTEVLDPENSRMAEHAVLVRDGQQLISYRAGSLDDDLTAKALLAAVVEAQWERYIRTAADEDGA